MNHFCVRIFKISLGYILLFFLLAVASVYTGFNPKVIKENNSISKRRLKSSTSTICENTLDNEDELDSNDDLINILNRRKGETSEERKARKCAVKELKRSRREQKKILKNIFEKEKFHAERQLNAANVAPVRLA